MVKNIYIIVGTRPNFIKITQFKKVIKSYSNLKIFIVHTGQHYDTKMADVFFDQFQLVPDFFLNINPGSANRQTAEIMIKLEDLFEKGDHPDLIMVVGDVNSTLAAALSAYKLNIPVAHLESGLRSNDRTMPEEINRILTDEISDYYFVTEESGLKNLQNENRLEENIFFVGNTMIDTLIAFEDEIDSSKILADLKIEDEQFVLMTMHRPATVDSEEGLLKLLDILELISENCKVVFPIHPRTSKNLEKYNLARRFKKNQNIVEVSPLDYFSFQKLIKASFYVVTDSGGIQEETTFLKKPCLTLRPNTERPVTCSVGTNTLVPFDVEAIRFHINSIQDLSYKEGVIPDLWDGKATNRIVQILNTILN